MTSTSTAQSPEQKQEDASGADLGEQQFMMMLSREVIPRLVLLEQESSAIGIGHAGHGGRAAAARPTEAPVEPAVAEGPMQAVAEALAKIAVEQELRHCQNFVTSLLREGHAIETIFLEVLQPAARHLGARWSDDSCNFAEVTMGMWNIQQVFTDLLAEFHRPPAGFVVEDRIAPSALFCTLPGCQHRLGVQMIAAFFTRAGWITQLAQGQSEDDLLTQIAAFSPELLGLSVSSHKDIQQAAGFIARVRSLQSGRAPEAIMLGGPAIGVFPELARTAGADLLAGDAPEALAQAETLLGNIDRGPR
ncbi:MAG: cobalamin B12-binding domain-containing protein [Burkholderiaceae bacterium]